jgi:hypothetical protein
MAVPQSSRRSPPSRRATNDISDILLTAPDRFEPIYRRKPNRGIDTRPGEGVSMTLITTSRPLCLSSSRPPLPIFVHYIDHQGRPRSDGSVKIFSHFFGLATPGSGSSRDGTSHLLVLQ